MLNRFRAPMQRLRHWQPSRPASTSSYLSQLRRRYPAADPPSLVASFVILHELTAIVPLAVLFGTFHYLGLGAGIVAWTLAESESDSNSTADPLDDDRARAWSADGARTRVRQWIREGEDKAERVGRRYGWFGWDKESKLERDERNAARVSSAQGGGRDGVVDLVANRLTVSGDVANVAAAYLVVKALLPLRILLSLRLSPSLANVIAQRFKGLRDRGAKLLQRNRSSSSP